MEAGAVGEAAGAGVTAGLGLLVALGPADPLQAESATAIAARTAGARFTAPGSHGPAGVGR
jgi:hypothetical protein